MASIKDSQIQEMISSLEEELSLTVYPFDDTKNKTAKLVRYRFCIVSAIKYLREVDNFKG